jgi:hypothetical protein
MGHSRTYFRVIRDLAIVLFLLTLAVGGGLAFLWRENVIQTWSEGQLIHLYVSKFKDKLPFTIVKVTITRDWAELLTGHLHTLSMTLERNGTYVDLSGPFRFPLADEETVKRLLRKVIPFSEHFVHLTRDARELRFDYQPHVVIRPRDEPSGYKGGPEPFDAHLWVGGILGATHETALLIEAGLDANAAGKWTWKALGIEAESPRLEAHWVRKAQLFTIDLQARSGAYTRHPTTQESAAELAANLVAPRLHLEGPLTLQPFLLASPLQIEWAAKSGELLNGDMYLSAGEAPLEGHAKVVLSEGLDGSNDEMNIGDALSKFRSLEIGVGPKAPVKIKLARVDIHKTGRSRAALQLETQPLKISELAQGFLADTVSADGELGRLNQALSAWKIQSGALQIQAQTEFQYHLPLEFDWSSWLNALRARLRVHGLSLSSESAQVAAKGIELDLPYSAKKGLNGSLAIAKLGWRHFAASLGQTLLQATPKIPKTPQIQRRERSFDTRIGDAQNSFPLRVEGIPIQLHAFKGTVTPNGPEGFGYELITGISLAPGPAQPIITAACVPNAAKFPPAVVQAKFTQIELSPGTVEFIGSARADLFEGSITASDLGFYDLDTEVPETDFSLEADQLRLDYINSFVRFGEMDGILSGYARDVVLQAWLPTQYKLELQVRPLRHKRVVFSADAMKNFARLFAGEGMDALPSYADWLAFGWPSRLIGGYNIDYAGIGATSTGGTIMLTTLDPPEITKYTRKHFILYGQRFKIPLVSATYPLVLDAPAMDGFVHRMLQTLSQLSLAKQEKTHAEITEDSACQPEGF